ncbi:MAG TPA: YceI family protein [Cyclobacteriaceae bacterium]|nr:YceI family protein [Cyclobacteriaceae bacterium]
MYKGSLITIFFLGVLFPVSAQRYVSENGFITFFSQAPVENIKADNNTVTSLFSADNGTIAFSVPIKEFQFEKKLMQQHFNDKYMESDRFPRATFAGKVTGYSLSAAGLQSVRARGKLTIHGIVKEVDVPGTLEVKNNNLIIKTKFKVLNKDYGIVIPQILWKNVSEEIEITVDMNYKKQ